MDRILIVDDDISLTMQLEEFLPSIGYEIADVASSGSEAIEKARSLSPDLVLMDIKMPGKLDGIQAAGIIKTEMGIPILFISGYANEKLLERAKLVEPLGYIHKPFSEEQVTAALKMACYQINRQAMWPEASGNSSGDYKDLTITEIRIAELLRHGKETKEIGTILKMSPATVIWHRKNIRKKLGIAETKEDIRTFLLNHQD